MSRVAVTISGPTGSGKSRLAAEIEIALKAIGVRVEWVSEEQEREARNEMRSEANGDYQPDMPDVVLQEINTPVSIAEASARLSS